MRTAFASTTCTVLNEQRVAANVVAVQPLDRTGLRCLEKCSVLQCDAQLVDSVHGEAAVGPTLLS